MKKNRSIGEKIGGWLQDHLHTILNIIAFAGISFLDIFDHATKWYFAPLVLLYAASLLLANRNNKARANLVDEIEYLKQVISDGSRNFYDVWDGRAQTLFKECGLTNHDRISIYKHDAHLDEFRLLGRHAENPSFRKRSRNLYPVNQGVIGKAWTNGKCFERKLPSPDTNLDKYVEENGKKYGLNRVTCINLTMKSTCLWGYRLSNEKDIPFAIVIVESVRRESLNDDNLQSFFDDGKKEEIEHLLTQFTFMEPNLRTAKDIGL